MSTAGAPAHAAPRRGLPVDAVVAGAVLGVGAGAVLALVALALAPTLGTAAAAVGLVALPAAALGAGLALRDSRWALALFAAALPAGLTTLAGGVQVVQVAAAAAVALVAVPRALRGRWPLVTPLPVVALLALVAWSVVVSTPGAPDLPRALRWDAALALAVLLAAAVATVASSGGRALGWTSAALCAGSVLTCAVALPQGAQQASLGAAVVQGRAQGVFAQPNELGLFAGTTLVLALALLVGARHRAGRWAAGAGAAVALVALGLSLSRGAWVGTAVAVALAAALTPALRRTVAPAVVVVALALVATSVSGTTPAGLSLVGARAGLIADRGANPYDERPAIWAEARRQVLDHPVVGVGPAGFPIEAAGSPSDVVASARPEHAHDVVLTVAAEQGLPAAGALVLALTALGAGVVRRRERLRGPQWPARSRAMAAVLCCAPLVALVHGLVDAPLRNPTTLLHTAAVLGLSVALVAVRRPTSREKTP